jgi:hypothetical protein
MWLHQHLRDTEAKKKPDRWLHVPNSMSVALENISNQGATVSASPGMQLATI